jgi:hypothetical protein
MTTYAFDPSTAHLLATWPTGAGASARTVARLNTRTPELRGLHLAKALTALSSIAWMAYTDPGAVELVPARPCARCAGRTCPVRACCTGRAIRYSMRRTTSGGSSWPSAARG